MKLNQKGFGAVEGLLVVIALTLIVGVGYYVMNANKDANTVASSSQKSDSKPATEKDPYAGWQTYTNSEAGFTLKYPSDWQFNAEGSKDKSGEGTFGGNQFVSKANYDAGNNANILQLATDTTTATAEQFAKDYFANKDSLVSSTSSKINGYSAQTVNFKSPTGNPDGYQVYLVKNGKVVQFVYYTGDNYTTTYKAIIDSIKFN